MLLAVLASIVLFTYWAYYRIVYKAEKTAWKEVELTAGLVIVFLVLLYFILKH